MWVWDSLQLFRLMNIQSTAHGFINPILIMSVGEPIIAAWDMLIFSEDLDKITTARVLFSPQSQVSALFT